MFTSSKSEQNRHLPPPTEYCCAACGSPGAVSEIHIYSPTNVFEKSVTILDALLEVFSSPNVQKIQTTNLKLITMCTKCAEAVSHLYQAFVNLMSLTNSSSYLTKLIIEIQNCHMQNPNRTQIELLRITEELAGFNSPTEIDAEVVTVTGDEIADGPQPKTSDNSEVQEEMTGKSSLSDPPHTGQGQGQETADMDEDRLQLQPTIRKGKYVCQNIQKRRYFKCHKCPAEFIPIFELYEHIFSVHENRTKMKCGKCDFTYFPEIIQFDTHKCVEPQRKMVKRSRSFICEVCGERFGGSRLLTFHIEKVHTYDNIRYKCHHCNKQLTDRHKLYLHMEIHAESKSYLCFHCGKSFSQKRGLDKHLQIHFVDPTIRSQQRHAKEAGVFSCQLCQRVFSYKRNLQQHLTMHADGENKYKCDVCQKPHWTRKRLEKHIQSHQPKDSTEEDGAEGNNSEGIVILLSSAASNEFKAEDDSRDSDHDSHKCHVCGNVFLTEQNLHFHLRKHMSLEQKLASLNRNDKLNKSTSENLWTMRTTDDDDLEGYNYEVESSENQNALSSEDPLFQDFSVKTEPQI